MACYRACIMLDMCGIFPMLSVTVVTHLKGVFPDLGIDCAVVGAASGIGYSWLPGSTKVGEVSTLSMNSRRPLIVVLRA